MKELNKFQNFIYGLGGILMAIGAVAYAFPEMGNYSPYIYTLGALLFAPMQMLARYDGKNLMLRRLRRQQLLSALLLLVSGGLLVMKSLNVGPFRGDEWLLVLTIAAVLQVYTAFRIPAILKQEEKGKK